MKATLSFNFNGEDAAEERTRFHDVMNADRYRFIIEEIWEHVFRPYFKHGYPDERLEKLMSSPSIPEDDFAEIMSILSDKYREILNANGFYDRY